MPGNGGKKSYLLNILIDEWMQESINKCLDFKPSSGPYWVYLYFPITFSHTVSYYLQGTFNNYLFNRTHNNCIIFFFLVYLQGSIFIYTLVRSQPWKSPRGLWWEISGHRLYHTRKWILHGKEYCLCSTIGFKDEIWKFTCNLLQIGS